MNKFLTGFVVIWTATMALGNTSQARDEMAQLVTADGVKLSAVWSLPEGDSKTVALILQGSGNVGADGDVSNDFVGHGYHGLPAKLSEQLASKLNGIGVASLRYAKRGVDDPTQLPKQIISVLITDAQAGVEMMRKRFPGKKIILVGFSEGALVSVHVAAGTKVDGLYLLGLPTRSIKETLDYQFTQWPVELLSRKLDFNSDGNLSADELRAAKGANLPILSGFGATWQMLDVNKDGELSVPRELIPAYDKLHGDVMAMMKSPAYAAWYDSFSAVPSFRAVAAEVKAPVRLYHALEDAQTHWSWVLTDQHYFAGTATVRFYPGLGHCFAPMEGVVAEVKTSGPFDERMLTDLAADIGSAF